MLFFIDESWQRTKNNQYRAGVLSAAPVHSKDFNKASVQIYGLKCKSLGIEKGNTELRGSDLFMRSLFKLESQGVRSRNLDLARDVFFFCASLGMKTFASVTFAKNDIALSCANEDQLDRPFFFLFERINQYMTENHPSLVAKLIFDDRGMKINKRISKSVSNFFHKSHVGKTFDRILKVPFFAISQENVGIQVADIMAHIVGRRFTGDKDVAEFFQKVKMLEYESVTPVEIPSEGKVISLKGIKVIKDKVNSVGIVENEEI